MFTKEDYIEKFHHFLHNLIAVAILVIKDMSNDNSLSRDTSTISTTNASKNEDSCIIAARYWSFEQKEKLLVALIKCFSLNMPLYLAYKHLLFNHDKHDRVKECACGKLSNDSISLIHLFCQSNNKNNSQVIFHNSFLRAKSCLKCMHALDEKICTFNKELKIYIVISRCCIFVMTQVRKTRQFLNEYLNINIIYAAQNN